MPGYRGGHILRIKIKNFMTYDELELFPKHGLNLIIGLNGSGKSSIMCAICLGLAGKPQYTGRSGQLSDFIKYGCDKATIEIELHDPKLEKRNIVITRIIQGDKSTWLLNKSLVSHHEVQNTVKKFNIDVSNLCQFLPQEKVAEFSKMDKKQRLENMLQAIGEPQLYNLFKELKQMKMDSLKLEDEIKRYQNHKEAESQINDRLKIDVDKHEEKLKMKESLVTLKQHKSTLEYRELREELIKLKEDRKPLREEEEKLKTIIIKLSEDINDKSNLSSEISEKMQELKVRLNDLQSSIVRKVNELEVLHEKADNGKIRYQNLVEEKRNQKLRLVELERQIKALQELHRKDSDLKPKLEAKDRIVTMELDKIKTSINTLGPNQSYAVLEKNKLDYSIKETLSEIEKMENEENKKLELLRQRFRDVYQAVIWLQQNKQKFKAPVHVPMLLLLKVANDEHRKFVENVVSKRDLIAFLCEDKEDNKLLTKILRQEKKLQVNIVMAPDDPIEYYKSPSLSPELRKLGIQCFLKDIIDAPDAIMRFLCHCCYIHTIPLCTSSAEKHMNDILEKFKVFFTPDARFQGKLSKYSKNKSIKRDPIKRNNLLPSCKDHSDQLHLLQTKYQNQQKELNSLKDNLQQIQEEMKELERDENALREEKREIQEKLQDIGNTKRQFKLKVQSYERKKEELIDEEAEKIKVTQLIQQISNTKNNQCAEIRKNLQEFISLKTKKLEYNLQARLLRKSVVNLKKLMKEKEEEYKTVDKRLTELAEKIAELTTTGLAMYNEIKKYLTEDKMTAAQRMLNKKVKYGTRKTIIELREERRNKSDCHQMNKEFPNTDDSMIQQFNNVDGEHSLPSIEKKELLFNNLSGQTKEQTEMEIRRIQAKLELDCEENESVIGEYKQRKARIELTEREIENLENNLKQLQGKMMLKNKEWLPALKKHIQNINNRFSKYYHQLNCAGEISLDTCNDTDDYPKYGLQITLKYRDNEPFMELSNTHHSGGECSVAAIIFILSLQELTEVPFRCIDEINQGMDSQNERNIYNLIADSAKNGSCSQYFLLTPKLLMDLEMIENRDVAVHIIFNSLFLDMKLDVPRHIELAG